MPVNNSCNNMPRLYISAAVSTTCSGSHTSGALNKSVPLHLPSTENLYVSNNNQPTQTGLTNVSNSAIFGNIGMPRPLNMYPSNSDSVPPPPQSNRDSVPPPPPQSNRDFVPPPPPQSNRDAYPPPPQSNYGNYFIPPPDPVGYVPPPPPESNRIGYTPGIAGTINNPYFPSPPASNTGIVPTPTLILGTINNPYLPNIPGVNTGIGQGVMPGMNTGQAVMPGINTGVGQGVMPGINTGVGQSPMTNPYFPPPPPSSNK